MLNVHNVPELVKKARLVAGRSNDPRTKVGCILLCKEEVIRAEGWNHIIDEEYASVRMPDSIRDVGKTITKYDVVVHAEMHALFNYRFKRPHACIVTHIPCVRCTAHLIWRGVKEIYWGEEGLTPHLGEGKSITLMKKHRINHGRIIV